MSQPSSYTGFSRLATHVWSLVNGKTPRSLLDATESGLALKSVRAVLRALNVEVGVVVFWCSSSTTFGIRASSEWKRDSILVGSHHHRVSILKPFSIILSPLSTLCFLIILFIRQSFWMSAFHLLASFSKYCFYRRPKSMYPSKLGKENSACKNVI